MSPQAPDFSGLGRKREPTIDSRHDKRPLRYSKRAVFAIVRAMFSDKDSARLHETRLDQSAVSGPPRSPALELAELRQGAQALESVGYYGRALAKLEGAFRLADRLASDDPALSGLSSELRNKAAQLARAGGRLQESLELSETAILKVESVQGRASSQAIEARLFRASTLLDLKRFDQALAAYAEIGKILKSSKAEIGLQLEGVLCSAAAVCASRRDFVEGARELRRTAKGFSDLVEGAVSSDFPQIASAFERVSRQFEVLGEFLPSSVFMQHSLEYRKMSSRGNLSPDVRAARLRLAELHLKAGRADAGLRASAKLLGDLSDRFGAAAPDVMAFRQSVSAVCFETGKWGVARALLEQNAALAERAVRDDRAGAKSAAGGAEGAAAASGGVLPSEARLVESLLALRDFLHATGHTISAGEAAVKLSVAREINPSLAQAAITVPGPVMRLVSEQFAANGGADPVVTKLAGVIDQGLRLARQRLAAGGLGEAVVSGLGSIEEQSFLLPDRVANKVLELIEEVRICAAETDDQLAVSIEAAKRRILRFEQEEGRSKELSRSKLYQEVGILCRRAGQDEAAAVYFRQARRLLGNIDLKSTRQYAETLLLSARLAEPELAGKMRRAARKILDRLRDL